MVGIQAEEARTMAEVGNELGSRHQCAVWIDVQGSDLRQGGRRPPHRLNPNHLVEVRGCRYIYSSAPLLTIILLCPM